jgi:hypothetical protein
MRDFSEDTFPAATAPQGVLARYFNVYRLAAYFLILFTIGHTLGAVVLTPMFGPESDRVVSAMKSVHVNAQGADCTWYGFYGGMSASVSLYMIFQIVLIWYLAGKTPRERHAFAPVTWALFLTLAAGIVNTWLYFFPAAIIFSTAVALLVGIGCVQDWRAGREPMLGTQ